MHPAASPSLDKEYQKTTLLPTRQLWKAAAAVNDRSPAHWEVVRIGEVSQILNGFAFKSAHFNEKSGTPLIRIRDLGKDLTETSYDGQYDARYIVKSGELLVGMDGEFRCVEWKGPDALLNQRVCKLTINPGFLNPRFVLHGINRHLQAIQKATSSLTVTHISSKTVADIPFPLPPRAEQDRIVAKIESFLGKIRTARQALDNSASLFHYLRPSILSKAFRGELTERDPDDESAEKLLERIRQERRKKWEEDLRAKGKDPKKYRCEGAESVQTAGLPEIPDTWIWTTLGQVTHVEMGQSPPGSSYNSEGKGIPLLNGPTEFGVRYPSPVQWTTEPTRICTRNDILICVRGNTTGRMNIADRSYCIGRGLAAIRPVADLVDLSLTFYFLLNKTDEIMKRTAGSTFPNLPREELTSFPFPLAPLNEQRKIVSKIQIAFEDCNTVEKSTNSAQHQMELLEQSILSKAFRGELASQDPSDESASLLLERIRGQRAAMSKKDRSQNVREFAAAAKINSKA